MTPLLTTGMSSWLSSILARWLIGQNSISLSKPNSRSLLIESRISSNEEVFKETCKLLGRLALDVRVAKCPSLRAAIEDSLESLFHTIPESGWEGMASPTIRTLMLSISILTFFEDSINWPHLHLHNQRSGRPLQSLDYSPMCHSTHTPLPPAASPRIPLPRPHLP